ncbi:hypothetical protein LY76DRAFT_592636 [Colletotrichum caudatum]|nr:hypothetical protein LY76DRAFT_592636 [Colletotrichum caudatum]
MASTPSSAELQKAIEITTRSFLAAFTDVNDQNDPSLINLDVEADCIRRMLPRTMVEAFGLPVDFTITNEAYTQSIAQNIRVYPVQDSVISDLVIEIARPHSHRNRTSCRKEGWESHPVEFSWFLDFNEDFSKVRRVTEF